MEEKKKNLSEYDLNTVPDASNMSFVIIVSEWNPEITFALRDGAVDTLKKHEAYEDNITIKYVPGSFELTLAAKYAAENLFPDAVICLGCVIQGETRHFEFINNAVVHGLTEVGLQTEVPVIFGVLTPDTFEQAKERAGGRHGNKGDEAAITAIKMADLRNDIGHFDPDDLWENSFSPDYDDEFDDEFDDDGPFTDDDDGPFGDDDKPSKLN